MFERLLEPKSLQAPQCFCGREMRYVKFEQKSADAAVKHFSCDSCTREMFLMVWPDAVVNPKYTHAL